MPLQAVKPHREKEKRRARPVARSMRRDAGPAIRSGADLLASFMVPRVPFSAGAAE